jgi:hypothetical protein
MASCCCWVLYRWWLGQRCFQDMVDTKPQRRRLKSRSITLLRAASLKSQSTAPRLPITTPLRHRKTTRLRMLPMPTTPKRLSTTLQPTLPRATTPSPRSNTLRKRIRIKGVRKGGRNQSSDDLRHGNNCSALSVINYIPHRVTSS